ncbi:winged helix-turn-helix transcriptional regulator [Kitasatospora sp. NBC_01287]|uniref:helix-turn-helix domain-containing protein n=1 Tax=Kitasatospora sp. NBC_01287 TaxID=2903573 RepID=UPI00224DDFF7|nr:helix-turn-helix domain-containing protein [Kitasatospora sp. NBC_01287]MCX4747561.1 winged helix-turn-helix transcriptional regulator [Kitasatospora sp. NBC_01287]
MTPPEAAEAMAEAMAVGPVVPDERARALYLRLLGAGGLFRLSDLTVGDREVAERLRVAGLVLKQQDALFWTVVNPRAAVARLSAGLRVAGHELLARADEPVPVFEELAAAYDRVPRAGRGMIVHLDDLAQIQQRMDQLGLEAEREILAAQPEVRRTPEVAEEAKETARELTARGVRMRVLYQPEARHDPVITDYATEVSRIGFRLRILREDFRRMVVFDGEVAVVPGSEGAGTATFIEDPFLVGVLVAGFERDWARAERVRWEEPVAAESDGPLVALLARGLTQRAIATRLGLSERTVAAQISRLRERHDARTLFQLGWQMWDGG